MSELTDKELEAIKSLNAEYRQAMFKRVASEQDGLYVLVDNDGPLILEDTEEDDVDILLEEFYDLCDEVRIWVA